METQILEKLNTLEQKLAVIEAGQRQVLTLDQAAFYLNVSRSHLYKLTSAKEIPHFKPRGKQVFFDRKELDSWLLQNRQTTKEEIDQAATDYVTSGRKAGAK
ncbi:MAG: helix-turn-helix domain-containing protein [Chlorobiales bacterium]|nr:helix-turn-helix domain-containing protein [Chlorobiales bacterium]